MALSISVKLKEPQLLAPSGPTTHELKQLSVLDDQKHFQFHFPIVMYYRSNPLMRGKDPVKVIREAVSVALVYYYPLAGRLIKRSDGKVVVDCRGQGILFVEADSHVSIDMLGDTIQPPCSYAGELLLGVHQSHDMLQFPLMLIQVTRFTCGGFALAIRANHMITDAVGLAQFLGNVADIARGHTITRPPVWCREVVKSRDPPKVTFVHHGYQVDELTNNMSHNQNIIRHSVFVNIDDIKALRDRLPLHFQKSSIFEMVSACVWISRTIALEIDPNEEVRLICVVNVRGKEHLNLPNGYYGNALVGSAAISKAGILCQSPLGYALELIKKAKAQVSEEYVRSFLDLVAVGGQLSVDNWLNFTASDTSRAGFMEVDLGWGKPIFGGPPISTISSNISGICRFTNSKGENGMVVPMFLPPQPMFRFQEELFNIIQSPHRPMNFHLLLMSYMFYFWNSSICFVWETLTQDLMF